MADIGVFLQFLMALALGALVGFERERFAKDDHKFMFGGIRTFMFISLLGAIAAYLSTLYFDWFIVPVFFGLVLLLFVSYQGSVKWTKGKGIGMTGEIVALLTFFYGAMALGPEPIYAVVLAILTTMFLYSKKRLHSFVKNVSREEVYSAIIFAIVAFVILPFLPDQTFGPYDVLNPYTIWLMVVFIAGMGFIGYILIKVLGSKKGIGLTGFLGGLVSSTAVTIALAGNSKKTKSEKLTRLFVFAVIIANAVMFARVIIEVSVVNKDLLSAVIVPISVMAIVALLGALWLWVGRDKKVAEKDKTEVEHTSPLSLGPAIKFGLLFGLVLFVVKAAQIWFGDTGLYIASLISGFVDVDAITLSMASLAGDGIAHSVAATSIVLAVMSNTIIKFGYAALLGSKSFSKKLGWVFLAVVVAGILSILLI